VGEVAEDEPCWAATIWGQDAKDAVTHCHSRDEVSPSRDWEPKSCRSKICLPPITRFLVVWRDEHAGAKAGWHYPTLDERKP